MDIVNQHTAVKSQVQQYEEALDQIKDGTKLNDSKELMNEFEEARLHNEWLGGFV